jgi:hypothetical protein
MLGYNQAAETSQCAYENDIKVDKEKCSKEGKKAGRDEEDLAPDRQQVVGEMASILTHDQNG